MSHESSHCSGAMRRSRVLGLIVLLWAALWLPAARAQIYIVDGNLNGGGGGVSVFAPSATGNVLPDVTLTGASTNISNASGVAASATTLYVLCNNFVDPAFVLRYSLPTAGNVASVSRTYLAAKTEAFPGAATAIAVDGTFLYVLENGTGAGGANGSVNVYPLSSLTSNTSGSPLAATRTIAGAATGLSRPNGLAVDGTSIYVANNTGNNLLIFALAADGDVAPTKSITGLNAPSSVAVDATTIYVLNFTNSRVTTYPISTAGGAVAAATTIGSAAITSGAFYVGVDATHVYIGDPGDVLSFPQVPSILSFPKATNSTSATPSTTISGTTALTALNSMFVLAPPGPPAPTVTASGGSSAFTTGGAAVAIDSGLELTAVPSTLATATIQVTTGWQSAQDALALTGTFGNIAGVYNATLGILRLESVGATATVAQWQSALRAVTYTNTSGAPNTADRTLTFKVFDGAQTSSTASKTVTIAAASTAPGAPTIGTATAGNGQAIVTFTAPASNGGSAITGYTVTSSPAGGTDSNAGSTGLSHVVTGLTNGTAYTFTVRATNAIGTGTASAASNSVTPFTVPGAPTIGTATAGNAQATVTFTAPASNGGSAITGYTVTSSPAGGTDSNAGSTGLSHVITGLTNGTAYTFTVTATNAAGTGAASSVSNSATPATVPGAPTIGSATAGNAQATVTFTAPASNGGSAITGYTVTSNPAGGTDSNAGSTGLSHVVTGLTPGTSYTFTVTATNAVGTGAASSASNAVIPPVAPTIASVSAPAAGTYKAGDVLSFTVTYDSAVTVTGTPTLAVTIGSNTRTATYVSGSGTTALLFRYTVALGDNAASGIALTSPLALGTGGAITGAGSVAAALTFTPPTTTSILVATKPVLTASGGSTAFTAPNNSGIGDTAVAVDGGITLTDTSAATLASATIQITGGLQASEDVLGFLNFNSTTYSNITPSYNASTGTLTLTSAGAIATLAQWQAALRTVLYYSSAITPNTANRTVSFTVNDGVQDSNTVTKTVTVTAVNQTPIVATTADATAYYVGDSFVPVDSGITVSDRNNATLASARVTISNFQSGAEAVLFANVPATMGNIAGSFVTSGGVTSLVLTSAGSTATVAQWQAALRAVTYFANSAATSGNRTITFVVNDGTTDSAAATKTVTVTPQATVASVLAPAAGTYAAGPTLNFTVTFSSPVTVTGAPSFPFTIGSFARNATYVSGSGTTTLTFRYTVALGENVSGSLVAASPIVLNSGSINGGASLAAGLTFTPPAATSITVSTAPVLVASAGNTTLVAGDNVASTPVAVDSGITLTDPSLTALPSTGAALVTIAGNYQSAEDVLAFTNSNAATYGDISGDFFSTGFLPGSLYLRSPSGTATIAQWQAALRAVTYTSTALPPNTTARDVSFKVNDGVQDSNVVTKTVTVTAVNQTPIVTTSSGSSVFIATLGAISVDDGVTVTDRNSPTLASASVLIVEDYFSSEDVLAFSNTNSTTYGNIAATYIPATGVLNLTSDGATATLAQWQAALRAVTYNNTAGSPVTRSRAVRFVVDDGAATSAAVTKRVAVVGSYATTTIAVPASATFNSAAQTVALSATLTSTGGIVNRGTVTFTLKNSSGTTIGTAVTSGAVTNTTATASYSLPAGTAAGTYTIQAAYNGAAPFIASSGTSSLFISTAATTVAASAPAVTFGSSAQAVTLTANVTSSGGGTVNVGTVTFTLKNSSGTTIGSAVTSGTVTNGTATASYSLPAGTAVGSYTVQAAYASAGSFASSSNSSVSLKVNLASTTTTVSDKFVTQQRASLFLGSSSRQIQKERHSRNMAVDGSGFVYCLSSWDGLVRRYTKAGVLVQTYSDLGQVSHIAVDASGNLYGVPFESGTSILFTKRAANGTITTQRASDGFEARADVLFGGIAVDKLGNVYVANDIKVVKSDSSGRQSVVHTASGERAIGAIVCDSSNNVFICSGGSVVKIGATGSASVLSGLPDTVRCLAVDSAGNLYYSAFSGSTKVFRLASDGSKSTYVDLYVLASNREEESYFVDHPWRLAFDSGGNTLYVTSINFGAGTGYFSDPSVVTNALTVSATVTSTTGVVNSGTVTFTLRNGSTAVGTPVSSVKVVNGVASASYPIPAFSSSDALKITADYTPDTAGGANFTASSGTANLTPTAVQRVQIFFGAFSTPVSASASSAGVNRPEAAPSDPGTIAAVLNSDGVTGTLVGHLAGLNAGFAVNFTLNDDSTFSAQTQALTSSTGTAGTLSFSGQVVNGVMTGALAELGLTFTANVDPAAGTSASNAGVYIASSLTAGGGATYSIVGTQGQVFSLALTPTGVSAGTGTISSTGSYTVTTDQGATVTGAINSSSGTTTATITAPGGTTVSVTGVSAAVPTTRRLSNLSLLGPVGNGQTITQGFVVSGPKTVLVRGIGPSLTQFGVTNALATPTLTIFDGTGQSVATNSGWAGDTTLASAFDQVGAFKLAATSRDAAVVATLQSGAYTLQVTGGTSTGTALAELYDLDPIGSPINGNLINLSSLGRVAGTATVMTAGFVIDGNSPRTVLIRGIGPSLTQFGVAGALTTPLLKLYDSQQAVIAQNQAWGTPLTVTGGQTPATASAIAATATSVGAFPLATGSNDSSIVLTLAPGSYTVHLSGANNTAGAALIEIYEIR